MPGLTAAELNISAEQNPDPAKPLVVPVDSPVVSSTRRFIPWSTVVNPGILNLRVVGPDSSVGRHQWLLPVHGDRRSAALYFERLSVLQLSIRAASWRRILGALSDLGVFGSLHVDEDAFRTACTQALLSRQIPAVEL